MKLKKAVSNTICYLFFLPLVLVFLFALSSGASANDPPVLSISAPNNEEVPDSGSFDITYTLEDLEDDAIVDFFYDNDNTGADGQIITSCMIKGEGTGETCSWDYSALSGSYYIYGVANDGANSPVTVYSTGPLNINAVPQLAIIQPDGVDDTVTRGDVYLVAYNLSDIDDTVTAAFYYDTNSSGLDGTAIDGCTSKGEGTGITCPWDTTGLAEGDYYVYGKVYDGTNPQVSLYSFGPITIDPTVPTLATPTAVDGDMTSAMLGATITDNGGTAITEYGIQKHTRSPLPELNWGQFKKLTATNTADYDYFGSSVSIDGNYMVIGAEFENGLGANRGLVYWFEVFGSTWSEYIPHITAGDAEDNDVLGHSVSISGDTVVAGAHGEDGSGGTNRGAAYIFQRDKGGSHKFGQVKKLTASDTEDSDFFGYSVAISGDTVVVGAYSEDGSGTDWGAAYVFERNNGGTDNWGEVKKLTASDTEDGDYFGYSVSISGDTIVVGAYSEDGLGTARGAAYVFERNNGGTDNWGEIKKLTASDTADNDEFGASIAINGNTITAGAKHEDGSGTDRGAVYVFDRDNGGVNNWGEVKKLTASDTDDYDNFGHSVAIANNTLVVGANNEDGSGTARGAAYIFQRDEGGTDIWGEVKKLAAGDAEDGDLFGQSVAVSGKTISVGAYLEDGAGTDRGAAYVFEDTETCAVVNVDPAIPETYSGSCTGMSEASYFFYRGYATNSVGTGYSDEGNFCTEPDQVSGLQLSNITSSGVYIQWTANSANSDSESVVLVRDTYSPSPPTDGDFLEISANAYYPSAGDLGDGDPATRVVFAGQGTFVNVSGLAKGVKYQVAVYAGCFENYEQDSPETAILYTEPDQVSNIVLSNITSSTMDIQWTDSRTDDIGYSDTAIVLIKDGFSPSAPADGSDYSATATSDFSTAPDLGDGTKVVFAEEGTSVSVSGLAAGKMYYMSVYAYAGSGTEINYQQDSPPSDSTFTEPAQASDIVLSNITSTTLDIQWTDNNPNADTAVVVIKDGQNPSAPADGTDYSGSANSDFSWAPDIGGGTKVVFAGSGTSVSVSGLTAGQEYYVAVYAYSSSGSDTDYEQDSPAVDNAYTEPTQATNAGFTNITFDSMQAGWQRGLGTSVTVLMKQGSPVDTHPVDGTVYSPGSSFGTGDQLGTGNYVAYVGDGTSITVTGLLENTLYHVAVYEHVGSFTETNYQQDSPATTSAQTECSTSWYPDFDGDTYGDPIIMIRQCSQPPGHVLDNTDCDDSDPAINPDIYWYLDNDGDGYGTSSVSKQECLQPGGYVLDNTDCDDFEINIYPGGPPARVIGTQTIYFFTLQNAFNIAGEGESIEIKGGTYNTDISNLNINSVTLTGGYDCSFTDASGNTNITGDLTISIGTLTINDGKLEIGTLQ